MTELLTRSARLIEAARVALRKVLPARTLFASAFWLLFFCGGCWIMFLTARDGADFTRYEAWSHALVTGDIFKLPGTIGTPLGVPLSVHSPGPGMLLSVGSAWFASLPLPARPDFLMMALCVACTWWAMLRLCLRLTSGNVKVAVLVLGLGFVGTHLGFYSGFYSSEAASLFAVSLLSYFVLGTQRIAWFDALLIGTLAGFAIVIRTQLVMYVALAIAIAAYRVYRQYGVSLQSGLWLVLAGLPCSGLMVETAYVNHWMTGSFLRTAYQFGDSQFQSVDWRRPEFSAVLVHPRHGLLAYHPLYLLGFACVLYLAVTARAWTERAVTCAAAVIVLLHLYLQAAWFCWWLGTATFGMRGMAPIAILLLPAIAMTLNRRKQAGRPIGPLIALCLPCAAWSLSLYFQEHSNFNLWSELWRAQIRTFSDPLLYLPALVATLVALAIWLVGRKSGAGASALAGALAVVALAAASNAWAGRLFDGLNVPKRGVSGWWIGLIALVTLGAALALQAKPRARPAFRLTEISIGLFVLALVGAASWQFQRLARHTEAFVGHRQEPERTFPVTSTILWSEIQASYREYQEIPGFTEPKARFLGYLNRHNREAAGLPPAPTEQKPGGLPDGLYEVAPLRRPRQRRKHSR